MKRLLLTLGLLVVWSTAFSQNLATRPRVGLTPVRITRMRADSAVNTPEWVRLRTRANAQLLGAATWDALDNLSLMYVVTGDPKYGNKAIEFAMVTVNLGPLDVKVTQDQGYNCRRILKLISYIYDRCYPLLAANRPIMANYLLDVSAWFWGNKNAWGRQNARNNYYTGGAFSEFGGLAVGDDDPRGRTEMARWRNTIYPASVQVWQSDARGGAYYEGTVYGVYSCAWLAQQLDAWQTATGEDLVTNQPAYAFFQASAYQSIHGTTSDYKQKSPFGDQPNGSIAQVTDYDRAKVGWASLLIGGKTVSDSRFWMDHVKQVSYSFQLAEEFQFYQRSTPATNYTLTEPPYWLAQGAGWIQARNGWNASDSSIWIQCGPLGESHCHRANGSFVVYKNGESVIGNANMWSVSGINQLSRDHNCLTINSVGQDHSAGAGTILYSERAGDYLAIAEDYGRSYKVVAPVVVRKFLGFPGADIYLVSDRVTKAVSASPVEWHLHSQRLPIINGSNFRFDTGASTVYGHIFGTAGTAAIPVNYGRSPGPGLPPALTSYRIDSVAAGGSLSVDIQSVLQIAPLNGVQLPITQIDCPTHTGVQVGKWIILAGKTENVQGAVTFTTPNSTFTTECLVTDLLPSTVYNGVTSSPSGVLRLSIPAGTTSVTLTPVVPVPGIGG